METQQGGQPVRGFGGTRGSGILPQSRGMEMAALRLHGTDAVQSTTLAAWLPRF